MSEIKHAEQKNAENRRNLETTHFLRWKKQLTKENSLFFVINTDFKEKLSWEFRF